MFHKNPIVKGAFILTLAGLISRFLGFFYRIFLSRILGGVGLGLYQLVFPIVSLSFALSCAGIQTSISKFVAENEIGNKTASSKKILVSGLTLSFSASVLISILIYGNAGYISTYILREAGCEPLIRYLCFSFPLASIHSCINGYYLGKKKASVPAISQLVEQICRVTSVYLLWMILKESGKQITPGIAMIGIVLGEAGSVIVCCLALSKKSRTSIKNRVKEKTIRIYTGYLNKIFKMAFPLTLNRVMLTILQSIEAILIPTMLKKYGMSNDHALSIYGVLTGMALPFIFFPSALTNSISVMLLPEVASSKAKDNTSSLEGTTSKTLRFCLLIGIYCTGIFSSYGNSFGTIIFGNKQVGLFIIVLSWLCPFMYLTTTLASILNGLGKTTTTFAFNTIGTIIKIFFIVFLIPKVGIIGYLWGVLASGILETILHALAVRKYIKINFNPFTWIIQPIYTILIAIGITYYLNYLVLSVFHFPQLINIIICCLIITVIYFGNFLRKQKYTKYI